LATASLVPDGRQIRGSDEFLRLSFKQPRQKPGRRAARRLLTGRRVRRLVLLVMLLLACERQRLLQTEGAVEVDLTPLDFGSVTLGASKALQVSMQNTSRSPQQVHVSAPAPFALDEDVMVPGGSATAVTVVFTPAKVGDAAATLSVSGATVAALALRGTGAAAPACANQPDGSPCAASNACLRDTRCFQGACLGQTVQCDDGDPCTTDICDPAAGCAHVAVECAEPADPCSVALCDPSTGCATAPAPDGTACGPGDCVSAHVCISGQCKQMVVPDGYACAGSSPCQGAGTCHAGVCEQPAGQPITEAWSAMSQKTFLAFQGVTDAAGNLYWLECDYTGFGGGGGAFDCELVSYTSAGVLRFRAAHSHTADPTVRQLISGGRFISAGSRHVTAASLTTGATLWERDVPLSPAAPGGFVIGELAVDEDTVHGTLANGNGYAGTFGLQSDGGLLNWSATYIGSVDGLVLDAMGNTYHNRQDASAAAQLVASSANDSMIYAIDNPSQGPRALDVDTLVTGSGSVCSATSGLETSAAPQGWWLMPTAPVLMASSTRWELGSTNACTWCQLCDCASTGGDISLRSYRVGQQQFDVHVADAVWPTAPVLLSDASVLLASKKSADASVMLRAIDAQGNELFACALPNGGLSAAPSQYTGPVAFAAGKWAVVRQDHCDFCNHEPSPYVDVFSVPGLSEAAAGWTSDRGGPSRSGRPH
jgi:hypothetical protein